MLGPWLDSCEAALLVYTAGRVGLAAVSIQPTFSAAIVCLAGVAALVAAHPRGLQRLQSLRADVQGAKASSTATLFHGLLGLPCLLGALATFCTGVWPLAWAAVEASACLLLWTLQWPTARRVSLLHLPAIKVAYGLASTHTVPLTIINLLLSPGGTWAPHLLAALLRHMPDTFTLGEAMVVTQAGLVTATAALHAVSALLQPRDTWINESHAAALFTLTFGAVATAGVAALGMLPAHALPWGNSLQCDSNQRCTQQSHAAGTAGPSTQESSTCHAPQPQLPAASGAQQPGSRSRLRLWGVKVLWWLLISTAGAVAAAGAAWVLIVFLPGGIPVQPAMQPANHPGPAQHDSCIDGLWLAAMAAEAKQGSNSRLLHRLSVLLFWGLALVLALVGQSRLVPGSQQVWRGLQAPLIVVRKGYHLLALVLFVPILSWDPNLLMVALVIAWALLLVLELCRVQCVPVLGPAVHRFMSGFVDERDGGAAYVTHLALMLGLAAPVWLSTSITSGHTAATHAHMVCACTGSSAFDALTLRPGVGSPIPRHMDATQYRALGCDECCSGAECSGVLHLKLLGWWLVALSGMVSVGVGDAVASVVGSLWGRHRLHVHTKKTWEGTSAGAIAMLVCNAWALGGAAAWQLPRGFLFDVALHTVSSAVLEALTVQLDNLVVPLWHMTWMVLCVAATAKT